MTPSDRDTLQRLLDRAVAEGRVPGIVTEVRRIEEQQSQTQTPPDQQVNVAPPPTER